MRTYNESGGDWQLAANSVRDEVLAQLDNERRNPTSSLVSRLATEKASLEKEVERLQKYYDDIKSYFSDCNGKLFVEGDTPERWAFYHQRDHELEIEEIEKEHAEKLAASETARLKAEEEVKIFHANHSAEINRLMGQCEDQERRAMKAEEERDKLAAQLAQCQKRTSDFIEQLAGDD